MKVALMSTDVDEIRAFFGWLYAAECPFDVVAMIRDEDPETPEFVQMELTIEAEPKFLMRRAGAEWYAAKSAELAEAQRRKREGS